MEKARVAANDLAAILTSGEWGNLQQAMGMWWDKLEQVEANVDRREKIQAWVTLWNKITAEEQGAQLARRLMADLQKTASFLALDLHNGSEWGGGGPEIANEFCKAYREMQLQLLRQTESFARRERQQTGILAELWDAHYAALCQFNGQASAAADPSGSREQLRRAADAANRMEEWAKVHLAADVPVYPDEYPVGDVAVIMTGADAAADKMLTQIRALNSAIGYKRGNVSAEVDGQLDIIELLQWQIIQAQGNLTAREWREGCRWSDVRKLLKAVSNFLSERAGPAVVAD
jgi:hypothetical protein